MKSRAFAAFASLSARWLGCWRPIIPSNEFSLRTPYLEEEDLRQALAYTAWRAEEVDIPLELV